MFVAYLRGIETGHHHGREDHGHDSFVAYLRGIETQVLDHILMHGLGGGL